MAHKISSLQPLILAARPCAAGNAEYFSVSQAEHVADINLAAASDGAIWRRVEQFGAVLLTKDEDFAIWHDMRGPTALSVVWIRIGNTRKAELIRQVEKLLPMIIERLEHGETLTEVR